MKVSRRMVPVALFVAVFGSGVGSQAGLAGTWRLDKAKSELSGGLRDNQSAIEQSLIVAVSGNIVDVKTTTVGGPLRERVTTERFEVDGRSHAFTPGDRVGSRSAQGQRTVTWTPDRRGLEIIEEVTREMGRGTFSVKNTHRWTLSADGAALVVESVIKGPQGEIPTRRVFARP